MFKSKFFIGILTVIVFFGSYSFFLCFCGCRLCQDRRGSSRELERDLNIYLRTKDEEEKRKLEFKIEAAISDGHDIAYEFIPRFYLARSTYFQNKGLYKKAIDDLDMIIDSKWIERDLAYINKAVVYEKWDNRRMLY